MDELLDTPISHTSSNTFDSCELDEYYLSNNQKISLPNGVIYKGNLINGEMCGYGDLKTQNFRYVGEFKNNLFEGYGKLYNVITNEYYEGYFHNGKKQGNGTLRCANVIYEGEWHANILCGYGRIITELSVYEGEIVNKIKYGKGVETHINGDMYNGEWRNGRKHGMGIEKYNNNNNVYEGEFIDNLKHGHGIMYYSNGDKYDGMWETNTKHGKCTLTIKNKKKIGEYINGRFYETTLITTIKNELISLYKNILSI
jgi:hypothetical protein